MTDTKSPSLTIAAKCGDCKAETSNAERDEWGMIGGEFYCPEHIASRVRTANMDATLVAVNAAQATFSKHGLSFPLAELRRHVMFHRPVDGFYALSSKGINAYISDCRFECPDCKRTEDQAALGVEKNITEPSFVVWCPCGAVYIKEGDEVKKVHAF